MKEINILKSKFVCPKDKPISECNIACPHYELCEEWKEIMFQYMEDIFGSLARGLFLR